MAQSMVLAGSQVKVYIGGNIYSAVQSVSYVIDLGQEAIYGVDSYLPQEIRTTRVSVQGTIQAVYVGATGGPQGADARAKINEVLYQPYVALRIKDVKNGEDLLFLPQCMFSQESMSISAKGTVKVSLSFKGIIPYTGFDLR
jgi:hypothetical protein